MSRALRTGFRAWMWVGLAGFLACAGGTKELNPKGGLESSPLSLADVATLGGDAFTLCDDGEADLDFDRAGRVYAFPVILETGKTVVVETAGTGDLDTVVALYGPFPQGSVAALIPVVADDDGGSGTASRLSWTVKEAGLYVVVATTWKGQGLGTAQLQVRVDGTPGCQAVPCVGSQCGSDADAIDVPSVDGVTDSEGTHEPYLFRLVALDDPHQVQPNVAVPLQVQLISPTGAERPAGTAIRFEILPVTELDGHTVEGTGHLSDSRVEPDSDGIAQVSFTVQDGREFEIQVTAESGEGTLADPIVLHLRVGNGCFTVRFLQADPPAPAALGDVRVLAFRGVLCKDLEHGALPEPYFASEPTSVSGDGLRFDDLPPNATFAVVAVDATASGCPVLRGCTLALAADVDASECMEARLNMTAVPGTVTGTYDAVDQLYVPLPLDCSTLTCSPWELSVSSRASCTQNEIRKLFSTPETTITDRIVESARHWPESILTDDKVPLFRDAVSQAVTSCLVENAPSWVAAFGSPSFSPLDIAVTVEADSTIEIVRQSSDENLQMVRKWNSLTLFRESGYTPQDGTGPIPMPLADMQDPDAPILGESVLSLRNDWDGLHLPQVPAQPLLEWGRLARYVMDRRIAEVTGGGPWLSTAADAGQIWIDCNCLSDAVMPTFSAQGGTLGQFLGPCEEARKSLIAPVRDAMISMDRTDPARIWGTLYAADDQCDQVSDSISGRLIGQFGAPDQSMFTADFQAVRTDSSTQGD